ncbi:hypothetical protein VTO73DRAFT_14369 [Trametes versicolor]
MPPASVHHAPAPAYTFRPDQHCSIRAVPHLLSRDSVAPSFLSHQSSSRTSIPLAPALYRPRLALPFHPSTPFIRLILFL